MRKIQNKEFYRELRGLMIPIAIQSFLVAAVSAGDSAMLGFVDETAMAAVALAVNVEFVESLLLSALTGGATIITAQFWAGKNKAAVQRVYCLILRYAVLIGGVFCLGSALVPETLMRVFTNEPELIRAGGEYLRTVSAAYLLSAVSQCCLCVAKATGRTKESAAISSFALGLDTVLNAVLILGFRMGVWGAAISTVVSRGVELILAVRCPMTHFTWEDFLSPTRKTRSLFWKCSLPLLLNNMVWGLGTTVYSVIIGHLGVAITAANSVASIVRKLSIALCRGLGQGGEILLAGVLGSGEMEKGREYGSRLAKLSVLCGVVCTALAMVIGPALSHFMVLSDEVRGNLQVMNYINAFYMLTQCVNVVVVCGVFSAGGDTAFDAYSVAVTMWGVIIPLALAAAFWWKLPGLVVCFILSLDEAVKIPWVFAHYKKYKWLKNITKEETP